MIDQAFLLIDAGNTRIKWATGNLLGAIRVEGEIATAKFSPIWARSLARKFPKHQTVLCCVVPKLIPTFRRAFVKRLLVVSSKLSDLGLHFDYPNPSEIGADRLAAAVAARVGGDLPAIIVNCGTATAFTVLDAEGRLCGGVIAPGLQTQLTTLIGVAAQLPTTELRPIRQYLARTTQDAIRAGVLLNFQGGVKEILLRLTIELPGKSAPHILLTGGNAAYLEKTISLPVKVRPLLIFEGLLMIGMRTFIKML